MTLPNLEATMDGVTRTKIIAALLSVVAFGCSTMTHGRFETIDVISEPPGTKVMIQCDGGWSSEGVTPAVLPVPRKAESCVVSVVGDKPRPVGVGLKQECIDSLANRLLEHIGPRSDKVQPADAVSAFVYLGIFTTSFLGAIVSDTVDELTGALCHHTPNPVLVGLPHPLEPTGTETSQESHESPPKPAVTGSADPWIGSRSSEV